MGSIENRQFSRISIRWAVQLDFGLNHYRYFLDNLSLSGFLVKGECRQSEGELCKVTIKESAFFAEVVIQAIGLIVRINESSVAVEFVGMKINSYFHLQASLLTKAVEPSVLGSEIVKSNIFEFYDDVVLCRTHNFNKNQIVSLLDVAANLSQSRK
jgi:hypothetical protein